MTWTTLTALLQAVLPAVGGLVVLWLALVLGVFLAGRRLDVPTRLAESLRLVPDIVRLLRRMAADRTLPRGVRIRLGALLVYLLLPIDLIPDFLPVIGYADDIIIAIVTIRSVVRRSGMGAVDRHWPGTPDGLLTLERLMGLSR